MRKPDTKMTNTRFWLNSSGVKLASVGLVVLFGLALNCCGSIQAESLSSEQLQLQQLQLQQQQQQQYQLLQQQQQQPLQGDATFTFTSNNNNNNNNNNDHSHHSGFLGMLMSPFRSTLNQARRLLTSPLQTAQEGVDMVRLQTFRMYMTIYNKTYSPSELPRRMAIFFDRRKAIEQSIQAFREGRLPFMMRENAFIDWDEQELKALTGVSPPRTAGELTPEELDAFQRPQEAPHGLEEVEDYQEDNIAQPDYQIIAPGADVVDSQQQQQQQQHRHSRFFPMFHRRQVRSVSGGDDDEADELNLTVRADRIPASKDWRASGCVATPINQEKCGACYAIATIGVLETMRCINNKASPTLSPQQVIDCSTPRAGYQNFGCNGGWPTRVFRYLQDKGVVARERCYPFVKRQTTCRLRQVQAAPGCTYSASPTDTQLRYKVLNNERDILYHVAKTGPVVTVMKATDKFVYYGSGIFDDPTCSRKRDDVDHAIVIVGYGRENGQDYWLIKNSWGTSEWGLNGYGKYKRGTNACSIGHWGWVITS